MIMQKLLLLHYVFTCKLSASKHFLVMYEYFNQVWHHLYKWIILIYAALLVQTGQNLNISVCCILCKHTTSCLAPPLHPFPFTPTYFRASNFMKQFLVNIIWYNKVHHYRNYNHTLKNIQNAHKMHNVWVLSVFHHIVLVLCHSMLNLSSGCFVSIKIDLVWWNNGSCLFSFPAVLHFCLPLRTYACNNLQPSTSRTRQAGGGWGRIQNIFVFWTYPPVFIFREGVGLFPSGFCGGRIE